MSADEVTRASVKDKLARYLLNPKHPLGSEKAKFFASALGFTRTNLEALAQQLCFDPDLAVLGEETTFGTKYGQTIVVVGANGRRIRVYTIWIKNYDGIVRLVTAFPAD